jgi:hypothetical protein
MCHNERPNNPIHLYKKFLFSNHFIVPTMLLIFEANTNTIFYNFSTALKIQQQSKRTFGQSVFWPNIWFHHLFDGDNQLNPS